MKFSRLFWNQKAWFFWCKKNGRNLILNTYFLDFDRYSEGGLGSINDRLDQKMKEINIMLNLFPKNVIIVDKANQPKGSHIRLLR